MSDSKPGSPMSRAGTAKSLATKSSFSETKTMEFTLEPDAETNSIDRNYPGVRDYYESKGSKGDTSKPLNLQSGLSNYSGLKLGDDRIAYGESVLSASYRIPVEHLMAIDNPSKNQTKHTRKREYQAALSKVGDAEINRLERVMKDKLFQRSYATSSPFQVRKAFKFFDRETTLRISIEGFTRALEFLGFQFAELQNLALFARYDTDFTGEIEYMPFIAEAMFYPAVEKDFGQANNAPPKVVNEPVVIDEKKETNEKQERLAKCKKVFDKVCGSGNNLQAEDFELLLKALGNYSTEAEQEKYKYDMGLVKEIDFDTFYDWFSSESGLKML